MAVIYLEKAKNILFMGILNNPKGRFLLHPEPFGRGASGHTVLEKQHLLNKMIVFQDALI